MLVEESTDNDPPTLDLPPASPNRTT